jgi:uncharacterized heparinase superfamily protein
MYHATVQVDLLEIIHLARAMGAEIPDKTKVLVQRMAQALELLSRSDGSLHLFNDSAQNSASSIAYSKSIATRVLSSPSSRPLGAWALPVTGYFGFRTPEAGIDLIVDCGPPGAAYQPGHAHCDLLSFELDVAGIPFVVDSGVHGYEGDQFREYVRSTRAHNTVMISGKEQSELWGTFRLARRAEVIPPSWQYHDGVYEFHGAYHPYHSRGSIHSRTITCDSKALTVTDRVSGADEARIESFVHFHPDATIATRDERFVISRGEVVTLLEPFGIDDVRIMKGEKSPVQGWYCPEFGRAIPQSAFSFTVNQNSGRPFGYRIYLSER